MIDVIHTMLFDKKGLLHCAIIHKCDFYLEIYLKYFENGVSKKRLIFETGDYNKIIVIKERAYILQNDKIFKLHREKYELFYQNRKMNDMFLSGKSTLKATLNDMTTVCFNL